MTDNRTTELNAMLGDDDKLLDLAHHAWSIAICAMNGMPIPASWGNAVEKGLRERGIDVDELPYVVSDAVLGSGDDKSRWHELFGTPERAARTLGNSREERTCKQEERGWCTEGDHARVWLTCGHDCMVPTVQDLPNYCPNCGARIVGRDDE